MDIIGKWEVSSILSFGENGPEWLTPDEARQKEDFDESILNMFAEFMPDGTLRYMIKLPENVPQEELDNAVASGAEVVGDYLVTQKSEWKEENGKYLFNSQIEGEIFGEEVSPWAEISVDDNDEITVMDLYRMKKM